MKSLLITLLFSLVTGDKIYIGEKINKNETAFYYYNIDFELIDKTLETLSTIYPENILLSIRKDFKKVFEIRNNRIFESQQTPYFEVNYHTSVKEFEWYNEGIYSNVNNINNTVTNIKNAVQGGRKLSLLPKIFRSKNIDEMGMPWPLWINNFRTLDNFSVQFQLIKYLPSLLPFLNRPFLQPTPLNSMFNLSKLENYSYYLASRKIYNNILFSTIIPIHFIQQNCQDDDVDEWCFFPHFQNLTFIHGEEDKHVQLHVKLLNGEKIKCNYTAIDSNFEWCFINESLSIIRPRKKYNFTCLSPPPLPQPSSLKLTTQEEIKCSKLIIPLNYMVIIMIVLVLLLFGMIIFGYIIHICIKQKPTFSYFNTELSNNNLCENDYY